MDSPIDPDQMDELVREFNNAVALRAQDKDLEYLEDPTERFLFQEIIDASLNLRYAYIMGRAVAEQNRMPNIGPASFGPSNGAS